MATLPSSREATAGHHLFSLFLIYSPLFLEKRSPFLERHKGAILCLRERHMVAAPSRLLEAKGLTIIVLETLETRGVAIHALLLLFYDILSFLRER